MLVSILFKPFFEPAMTSGQKTVSSRTRRMGKVGDCFGAFGVRFVITGITTLPLAIVADILWREEGCQSPLEFKQIWTQIHPQVGFDARKTVYTHHFRMLDWLNILTQKDLNQFAEEFMQGSRTYQALCYLFSGNFSNWRAMVDAYLMETKHLPWDYDVSFVPFATAYLARQLWDIKARIQE